jgi:hypothetical protein
VPTLLEASVNSPLPSEAAALDDVTVGAGESVAKVEAGEADVCAPPAVLGEACKAAAVLMLGAAAGEAMLFVDGASFFVIVASAAGLALSSVDDDGFWDSPVVVSMVFCKPTTSCLLSSLEKRRGAMKAVEGYTTELLPTNILFVPMILKEKVLEGKTTFNPTSHQNTRIPLKMSSLLSLILAHHVDFSKNQSSCFVEQ